MADVIKAADVKDKVSMTRGRASLVKMYGTEKSQFHKVGEETLVAPGMVEHFKKRGLSLEKPEPKEDSAPAQ